MKTNFLFVQLLAVFFILCTSMPQLEAHAPDQSYLYMRIYGDGIGGRFEITAKDLNRSLNLNLPDRMDIADVEPHISTIQAYLDRISGFSANGTDYRITFDKVEVLKLDEMEDFAKL